jgi:hypothetical protein
MLAPYAGDVLVEHDVTFALVPADSRPLARHRPALGLLALAAIREKMDRRYRKVVVMSEQDRALLNRPNVASSPTAWIWRDSRPKSSAPASAALHRVVPAFPKHRRLSIFRRTGLAHPAQTFFRKSRLRWSPARIRCFTGASTPDSPPSQATIASACSNLSPTFGRSMSKRTSPSFPRSFRPARISRFWKRWRWIARWSPRPPVAPGWAGTLGQRLDCGPAGRFRPRHPDSAQDDGLRRRIAEAGRVHVERNYGWRRSARDNVRCCGI